MVIFGFLNINLKIYCLFVIFIVFTSFVNSADIQRVISNDNYLAGSEVNVSLNVVLDINEKIINYGVEEYIPSGWVLSYISPTGFYANLSNKIIWVINSSNNNSYLTSINLSYVVIPNKDYGQNLFSGFYMFSSANSSQVSISQKNISGEEVILGDISLINNTQNPSNNGGGGGGGGGSTPRINSTNANASFVNQTFEEIRDINLENIENSEGFDNNNEEAINEEKPKKNSYSLYIIILFILVIIGGIIISLSSIRKRKKHNIILNSIKDNYL